MEILALRLTAGSPPWSAVGRCGHHDLRLAGRGLRRASTLHTFVVPDPNDVGRARLRSQAGRVRVGPHWRNLVPASRARIRLRLTWNGKREPATTTRGDG